VGVLHFLGQPWVLATALAAVGLLFLGDIAAQSKSTTGSAERFLLNILSLPAGILVVAGILVRWSRVGTILAIIGLVVGAVSIGRSLREVPWTGVVSVAAAAFAVYGIEQIAPGILSVPELLAVGGIVFLIVYVLLYLIEIPLRLAGLLSIPRPFLAILAVASFVGAALVFV
jgi:hypothetical protein